MAASSFGTKRLRSDNRFVFACNTMIAIEYEPTFCWKDRFRSAVTKHFELLGRQR